MRKLNFIILMWSMLQFARMTAEELATPQLRELREHLSEGTMVEHMMGEKEAVGGENIIKSDNAI